MNEERGRGRLPGGLTLRALAPNAITAAALCVGLTGIRFAIGGEFERAIQAVIIAGLLDGIDGRIARLLKAESRFGAELDSLADSISFGVAPALILFLWALQPLQSFGWVAALWFAICCVLRLARYNAHIDMADEPRKQAGYLTGVPAPLGGGLAFLPMYLWIASDHNEIFAEPLLVAVWLVLVAFLMISNLPTLSWGKLRPRRGVRLEVIAVVAVLAALLLQEPWFTLAGLSVAYLLTIPFGVMGYWRSVRRRRASRAAGEGPAAPPA